MGLLKARIWLFRWFFMLIMLMCCHIHALLNPAHALHGGVSYFAFVCVCVCVCVPVDKISQKVFSQSTSFLVGALPVTQGKND